MDIMAGLAAVGQAINIARVIREADIGLHGAEIKAKMAELYEKLSDAKMALVDAREEIDSQAREIEKLKEAARYKAEETVALNGLVYAREPDGSTAVYPFCPKCLAVDGLYIRILSEMNYYEAKCPNCKTAFAGPSVWSRKPVAVEREEAASESWTRDRSDGW